MNARKTFETLAKEKAPGPSPSFQLFHIIKMLEVIAGSSVGRGTLSKELGIGAGAARTLIERLREEGIIAISKQGCVLTQRGKRLWKKVQNFIPSKIELERSQLTLSAYNVAILVRAKANKVRLGMEQRDAAVLAGAQGATTLVMNKGKLTMPHEDRDIEETVPETHERIICSLKPHDGDVIIIGSGDNHNTAEYGAIAAAWVLFGDND